MYGLLIQGSAVAPTGGAFEYTLLNTNRIAFNLDNTDGSSVNGTSSFTPIPSSNNLYLNIPSEPYPDDTFYGLTESPTPEFSTVELKLNLTGTVITGSILSLTASSDVLGVLGFTGTIKLEHVGTGATSSNANFRVGTPVPAGTVILELPIPATNPPDWPGSGSLRFLATTVTSSITYEG